MVGLASVLVGLCLQGVGDAVEVPVPLVLESRRPLRARVGLLAVTDGQGHDHDDSHDGRASGEPHAHGPSEHEGFEHRHASPLGTPQVHGFLTEPAFLGRDILAHAAFLEGEIEVEVEVEWALSERALVVAGVPYVSADGEEDAIGPAEAAFRWRLRECDRWVLSVQGGAAVPAESDQAVALEAALLGWLDLGRDVTLQGNLGVEVEPEEGAWSVPFAATLAWTTPLRSPFVCPPECGHVHAAEPRLSLLAEVAGALPFDGEIEATGLLGAVFPLTRRVEVRVAWTWGLAGEVEGDSGIVVGTVVHF